MTEGLPAALETWLAEQGCGAVTALLPVGGGCINDGARLRTQSGRIFFLKRNRQAPADLFEREAEGLAALAQAPGGPRIPQVYLVGVDFLLLEDLAPALRRADYWPELGRQLARLHGTVAAGFGFAHDNYIGSTPQPNRWTADGTAFFAEQRLLFQAELARRRGLLPAAALRQVERLCARLPELIPAQPASLLHGDLWSGNAISDERGAPALIDPAAYYGWAEAELAMTALFGGFPEAFYQAYESERPLVKGASGRFAIYNLYHLLNHLNLFGMGYLAEVQATLIRYGA